MVRVKVSRDAIDNLQNAKERYDKAAEIQKKLTSPPPSGLIPIGDTGLYRTPDVISPKDCEFYPDSPYCGGNPLTRDSIGLDLDWGVDGCSIHASVTPKLGFMKLPTHTIAYVREECREQYEAEKKPPEPPNPTLPEEWQNIKPDTLPPGFKPSDIVCAVTVTTYILLQYTYNPQTNTLVANPPTVYQGSLEAIKYPGEQLVNHPTRPDIFPAKTALATMTGKVTINRSPSNERTFGIHPDAPNQNEPNGFITTNDGSTKGTGLFKAIGFNNYALAAPYAFVMYVGRFGDIFPSQQLPLEISSASGGNRLLKVSLAYLNKLSPVDDYSKAPKDRRKRECCMTCCGSQTGQGTQRQQQDLEEIKKMLRQILKNQGTYPFSVTLYDTDDNKPEAQTKNVSVADQAKAQKLIVEREEKNAKSIGIDQFPIYVPSSIVEDRSNGLLGDIGNVKNKIFKQRIESIAELLTWKIGNDREIFGAWQEYIDIQDSDPQKKGNQPKRVVLPNMARSFRELVLLNSVQIKTTGLLLDAVLKMYIDIANTKVSSAVTEAIVRDIQGFLDYPTDEKPLDVPLGIKIPSDNDSPDDKEDIQRFLSNSTVIANFDDWTGEGSLHDLMVTLLDAAAMIRAAFFQKG